MDNSLFQKVMPRQLETYASFSRTIPDVEQVPDAPVSCLGKGGFWENICM